MNKLFLLFIFVLFLTSSIYAAANFQEELNFDYSQNYGGYIKHIDAQYTCRNTRLTFIKGYYFFDYLNTNNYSDIWVVKNNYYNNYQNYIRGLRIIETE